jgi:hypothetical protein
MTISVSLNTISNLQDTTTAQTTLNNNNAAVTGGFTTALNVTGDQMKGNLDMNSNQILNLPAPATANSPVRLVDVTSSSSIASVPPVGTSGAVVPLLNANNTWSGTNTFAGVTLIAPTNALTNTRLAKTSAYSVANADKGSTIALGGTAFYSLTFNTGSGYDANFIVLVVNEDTTRAKYIVLTGGTSFYLWPNQSCVVFNDNNTWHVTGHHDRWVWNGSVNTFYFDNVLGSDVAGVTDGLATGTGAFATATNCNNFIQKYIDQRGGTAVIQAPLSTSAPITENVSFFGAMDKGVSEMTLQGNTSNPLLCQWTGSGNNTLIQMGDYQSVTVQGFNFSWTEGTPGTVMASPHQFGILDCYSNNFGAGSGCVAISCSETARANLLTGNSISGSWGEFIQCSDGGTMSVGGPLNITATSGITTATFISVNNGGITNVSSLAFTGSTANLAGLRFLSFDGGIISGDNAVTWPASMTAGYCQSGGISDGITLALTNNVGQTLTSMPANAQVGYISYITDATVTTQNSAVTGGGANTVLAWYNGAAWKIIAS